jgi:hypothetical protein
MILQILTLWLMLAGEPACAERTLCSCAIRSQELSFTRAEAVFTGVATELGELAAEEGQPVTFRVTRRWKGTAAAGTIVVRDAHPCGVYFRAGSEYVVYALRSERGQLYTTFCARSRLLSEGAEDVRALDAMTPRSR